MDPTGEGAAARLRWVGLGAGPLLAVAAFLLVPDAYVDASGGAAELSAAGRMTLAAMAWMATWWLTEAVDVAVTALLPLAIFPLLGIASMKDAAAPYGSDLVFLFMGGFLMALSMQRWGLDRRIALLTLRLFGTRPPAMIAGFMAATACISAWVSNTATAAMMMPVALGVAAMVAPEEDGAGAADPHFGPALMLGIAYAASIGGVGSIIGSPPNGILVEVAERTYGREIGFAEWFLMGLPFVALMLPLTWALLVFVLHPVGRAPLPGGADLVAKAHAALGTPSRGEWATFAVFMTAATCWIARPLLVRLEVAGLHPLAGLTDAGIAMIAGLALFLVPIRPREGVFAMDWRTAVRLPWGILVLFGGGLSLAAAMQANGVAEYLASHATSLRGLPVVLLLLVIVTAVVFLGELASNTAMAATLLPVLAAMAPGLGVSPWLLLVPATIAASCGFMLPVATPPNAIVYGTGRVTTRQMARAGLVLDLAGIAVVTLLAFAVVAPLFG